MRHPTVHQPAVVLSQAEHGQPDGVVDLCAHRDTLVSQPPDVAACEAHRQALTRWPLLAEIDEALSRESQDPRAPGSTTRAAS